MNNDRSYLGKLTDFISQWIVIQKKNPLKLTIYEADDKIGSKVYLSPLEHPNSYSEARSTYEKFKFMKGCNLKLIDEKMDDQDYLQLHTIISTISKIQGISLQH
ncbi:MAG: hypothetical protein P9M11_08830 [Candidatus Tenebribacter burtonii]|jgi:hypothetical protein|nr:hypothetical protein [Candidatus Tenebribacter burtonii]